MLCITTELHHIHFIRTPTKLATERTATLQPEKELQFSNVNQTKMSIKNGSLILRELAKKLTQDEI